MSAQLNPRLGSTPRDRFAETPLFHLHAALTYAFCHKSGRGVRLDFGASQFIFNKPIMAIIMILQRTWTIASPGQRDAVKGFRSSSQKKPIPTDTMSWEWNGRMAGEELCSLETGRRCAHLINTFACFPARLWAKKIGGRWSVVGGRANR